MRPLIKLKQTIIVEGKYDKIRLANIIDATIITTEGFRIFKDKEKRELIRILGDKNGLIVMTDSDKAGQLIRNHIKNIVPKAEVINVYLPQIKGKEKRKTSPSAEGVLGVEGTDDGIIISALNRAGITGQEVSKTGHAVTKTHLFNLGLSGWEDSAEKRADLCTFLGLPDFLSANSLLEVINSLYGYDEFLNEVTRWKQESAES